MDITHAQYNFNGHHSDNPMKCKGFKTTVSKAKPLGDRDFDLCNAENQL
jgi:hypothetical protein